MPRSEINRILRRIAEAAAEGDGFEVNCQLFLLPDDVLDSLGTRLDSSTITALNLMGLI